MSFKKAKISNEIYEIWITRAIIFHLENKDIYFEKDNTAFFRRNRNQARPQINR